MKHTTQRFVADAIKVHADRYDYTDTMYNGSNYPVTIVCRKHGPFTQRAALHIRGSGCPECARALIGVKCRDRTWNQEQLTFLKTHYIEHGRQWCAKELGRPGYQVSRKAAQLGLTKAIRSPTQYKYVFSGMWNNLVTGAKQRDLSVEIDEDYIHEMYVRQNGICVLSGVPIVLSTKRGDTTASVDRIDSTIGYTQSNVQLVHKAINRCKLDSDEVDFYAMCQAIYEHCRKDFEYTVAVEEWDEWHDTGKMVKKTVIGRPPPSLDFSEEAIFGDT